MKANLMVGIGFFILAGLLAFMSKKGILGDGWLDKADKIASVVALVVAVVAFINPFAPNDAGKSSGSNAHEVQQKIAVGDRSSGNQSNLGGTQIIASQSDVKIGTVVNAQQIEQLTIYPGDPPDVKQQKIKQAKRLIGEEILSDIMSIDTRLDFVKKAVEPDEFEEKLRTVRQSVAPSASEAAASGYRRLIVETNLGSLRQAMNTQK